MRLQVAVCRLKNINIDNTGYMFKENFVVHCKFLPHENYRDWKIQGPCRENLHYLWKRAVRIKNKPYVCCG